MSVIDNQALGWLRVQSERELSAHERAEFEAWLEEDTRHKGAYVRALVIHNAIEQTVAHQHAFAGQERQALRTGVPERHGANRRGLLKYAAMAAGVAVLGAGAGVALDRRGSRTTLATAKGEFRRVALADTSVASINSGSRLEVKLTREKRQITLVKGEAWFDVAKDKTKPFVVEVGSVQVRAVGTAFGVHRLAEGAEVLVTEGTVEVWTGTSRARLTAGQRSVIPYRTAQITVARQPQEIQRKLAWRDGKLIFSRQTLSEAVADFNRYSAKKIIITDPSLGSRRIFGQYQIDAPEQFAKDIGAYLNVPIEVSLESITIGAKEGASRT